MLERIWEPRSRTIILLASAFAVLAIAAVDWWTKPYFSLGFLYLFPIMLAAGFLPRWAIVVLGIGCALLSERFSNLDPSDSTIRLTFETLALCGCGLFTSELLRNRRLSISSQERLRVLVETSPAAIVTIDERGFIELANRAATELMAPRDGHLIGYPIAAFLPELHHALRWEDRPQFRTSMQCRGHRGNGETFLADVWFSSYKDGANPKLAAIIADVSEEQAAPHLPANSVDVGPARASPAEQSRTGRTPAGGSGSGQQRNSVTHGNFRKCGQEYSAATVRQDRGAYSRPARSGCIGTISRSPVNEQRGSAARTPWRMKQVESQKAGSILEASTRLPAATRFTLAEVRGRGRGAVRR